MSAAVEEEIEMQVLRFVNESVVSQKQGTRPSAVRMPSLKLSLSKMRQIKADNTKAPSAAVDNASEFFYTPCSSLEDIPTAFKFYQTPSHEDVKRRRNTYGHNVPITSTEDNSWARKLKLRIGRCFCSV